MAKSPTHKLGQLIGETIERALEVTLRNFVGKYSSLYLDKKGYRPCRGKMRKCTWEDQYGNSHDLDFVIERGGTPDSRGTPAAFIEVAWRRYTKHSKNKAQEIQGAITPLQETYQKQCPFLGAVLAGDFTSTSLEQLESHGFKVLYFNADTIVKAFAVVGVKIDRAEDASDESAREIVDLIETLTPKEQAKIEAKIRTIHQIALDDFLAALALTVNRKIAKVRIFVLHGTAQELSSVTDTITFIKSYDSSSIPEEPCRIEITIYFTNGDKIEGSFEDRVRALDFLKGYNG